MLTITKLREIEKIKDLDQALLDAIAEASKADEDKVISNRIREIHDQYDRDIRELTGTDKPADTKSYDYLRIAVKPIVDKANGAKDTTELQSRITKLEDEKKDLEKQLKDGITDQASKTRISDLERQLKDRDDELTGLRKDLDDQKKLVTDRTNENTLLRVTSAFDDYIQQEGYKFKPEIDQALLKETLENRKNRLLARITPDTTTTATGQPQQVFRSKETSAILRDPDNSHEPFTAGRLWYNEIKDLLAAERNGQGGGSKPPGEGGGGNKGTLDLNGAKTQREASERITDYIIQTEGIAKTDPKFAPRELELYKEHKVEALPLK